MKASDYEDTIAAIEADYERGEYSDDPEMAGRRASREQQEALERRQRPRKESKASVAESAFISAAKPNLDGSRTLANVELELAAGRLGYQAAPWLGPLGPRAIPEVADTPQRFKSLIELWSRDKKAYERHLRDKGLIR